LFSTISLINQDKLFTIYTLNSKNIFLF